MCVVDDDGIGIGYVYSVLHYRRGKQQVILMIHKSHDDFLQLFRTHLPVTYGNTAVGHNAFYLPCKSFEGGNAVVDEIDLTVAAHLEVDCLGN